MLGLSSTRCRSNLAGVERRAVARKWRKIDAAVAPVHLANDRARPDIERDEQIRGAVADVVVRVALELARGACAARGAVPSVAWMGGFWGIPVDRDRRFWFVVTDFWP